ncbi:MAG: hypothetical protein R3182_07380, partial [Draconibacterium sp.]|nr:hypothetical protein [Draconibacterium sp.]
NPPTITYDTTTTYGNATKGTVKAVYNTGVISGVENNACKFPDSGAYNNNSNDVLLFSFFVKGDRDFLGSALITEGGQTKQSHVYQITTEWTRVALFGFASANGTFRLDWGVAESLVTPATAWYTGFFVSRFDSDSLNYHENINNFLNGRVQYYADLYPQNTDGIQWTGKQQEWIGSSTPTNGFFLPGDRIKNATPAVGQPKAWICTTGGVPGIWVSEGNL